MAPPRKQTNKQTGSVVAVCLFQTCAPLSTPSWPPRFPSSQVRLPPLLCAAEHWGTAVALAVILVGAGGWGRPISPPDAFWGERSHLVCRHLARPRPGASRPDRSDGRLLIDGRQSDSQTRACIVHRVHPSLRHRRRRAFPPRRFVSARSAPVHAWRAVGRGGLPTSSFGEHKILKRRVQLTFVMVA